MIQSLKKWFWQNRTKNLSDTENERIFNNLGLNKDFVEFLKNNMSGTALRSLDNKIYDLY